MGKHVKGPDSISVKELKSDKLCGQKKKKQTVVMVAQNMNPLKCHQIVPQE